MAETAVKDSDPDASLGSASDEEQQAGRDDLVGGNEGWANVFAKVLTQNPKLKKKKKTVVLSKARKDAEIERRKELAASGKDRPKKRIAREPMKIVDGEGKVVDEEEVSEGDEDDNSESDEAASEKKSVLDKIRRKKERLTYGLVEAQPGDPYEKNLLRTATKGVVQLFNAVNKHQEQQRAKQKADSSDDEDHRYKKGRFMDTLYKIQEKKKGKDESKWEALKDDFMMNSKMRDWDKQAGSDDD
ncbi:RRP15-like protein [Galendromus occidentalis]|uniref:RRP15-like protein n=1 Tax=Galendromus occidentalis TaxID=34638 RepID=A0AAJ6QW19_9ACAR|nr:RRP15-like protein [Galendromus occidentalis]